MSAMLLLVDRDDDFLKYGAKEFFLVSWQGGWSPPNGGQVSTQSEQAATLIGAERLRSQCFANGQARPWPYRVRAGLSPTQPRDRGRQDDYQGRRRDSDARRVAFHSLPVPP